MNEPLAAAAAATSTNFTVIGILAAIFVPICATIAVITWNHYRLQRHRAGGAAHAGCRVIPGAAAHLAP